ncbi:rhodanese-like domain-containing protein [Prescottella sp. R16]|uniref:rhodanese-like domain-containing protein n=1 Tax=Prescottella sp. R16 TaxID=3064529 RepID=UPI00272E01CD|nr:rhodanese-like domain-containing protein [Prescottella sp. R16]
MSSPHVPTVSVTDLPTAPTESVVLLDVREDDEWTLGHAPGAQHIPLVDIPARIDEVDIDAEVYVVCRQGGRSILAVEYLNNIGYDAYNVSGGMVAWQQAGLPLTSDDESGTAKIY